MTPTAVAIYNRANTVCSIPDRIFLSAIFSFAFPALAAEVREGGDVRRSYLRALSYITVLYWPSLIMVAILADPIVRLALETSGSPPYRSPGFSRLRRSSGFPWF